MTESRMKLLERSLIIVLMIAMLLALGTISRQDHFSNTEPLHQLSDGWYRKEGDIIIPVSFPCSINVPGEEDLTVYYDDLSDAYGSHTIFINGTVYRPKITFGDSIIYQYHDEGFPRNQQMRSKLDCTALLPEHIDGKQLAVTYENQGNGRFYLNPIYVGLSSAVLRQQFKSDVFTLLIVYAMGIIGVTCAGAHLYLKIIHMPDNRLANASWFLLLCALWCMLDSSLIQQLSNQSPFVCALSFYAYMTMVTPMVYFVRNTADMAKYKSIDFCIILLYLNAIIQSFIHNFWHVNYIDMLFATHLLQIGVCSVVVRLMLIEYRKTANSELHAVLQSVLLLASATLIDLVLYWLPKVSFYGFTFQCGLLIFIIRLLCSITSSMASNLRFKTEAAVYKRLSREDRLTELENRRSFDDFLAQLEQNSDQYKNVALVFLDLNGLKFVNDRYGHSAGDELIIGAARCIKNVFSPSGSCYRIGGDEFAVIIPSPDIPWEQWNGQLEEAICSFNQNSHYHLSIARGISYLRDNNGNIKRFSDWKYEADQAMYSHKSASKTQSEKKEVQR